MMVPGLEGDFGVGGSRMCCPLSKVCSSQQHSILGRGSTHANTCAKGECEWKHLGQVNERCEWEKGAGEGSLQC